MPEMIRFYLGEEPILANVPTWQCGTASGWTYVLAHLGELVAKEVHGSGGYGMLIGPKAARRDRRLPRPIRPTRRASSPSRPWRCPPADLGEAGVVQRHADFRPFCLVGQKIRLVPGGLTRVALTEGSLVVNSSQGGGIKDTWVP